MILLAITIYQILGLIFIITALYVAALIKIGLMIVSSYYDNDNDVEVEEDPEDINVDTYPYNEELTRI